MGATIKRYLSYKHNVFVLTYDEDGLNTIQRQRDGALISCATAVGRRIVKHADALRVYDMPPAMAKAGYDWAPVPARPGGAL